MGCQQLNGVHQTVGVSVAHKWKKLRQEKANRHTDEVRVWHGFDLFFLFFVFNVVCLLFFYFVLIFVLDPLGAV
jgi:hypothetical protein